MKRLTQKIAAAVVLVVILGLINVSVGPAPHASALVGGESVAVSAGAAPWAAFVNATDTVRGKGCSGALVAPDWVLTAAHCVINDDGFLASNVSEWGTLNEDQRNVLRAWFKDLKIVPPASMFLPSEVSAKIGVTDRSDMSRSWVPVDQIEVFDPYLTSSSTKSHDIALLHLVNPVSDTPIGIADAASATDRDLTKPKYRYDYTAGGPVAIPETFLTTVASGMTCEDCDGGTLRATVSWVDERNDDVTTFRHTRGGNDFLCKGDSGGPSIAIRDDGTWVVVGVHSWGIGYTLFERESCFEYAWDAIVGRSSVSDWMAIVAPTVLTVSSWAAPAIGSPAPNPQCDGHDATIIATSGTDTYGTPGDDVIIGTDGDDVIYAGGGHDIVCGNAGNDTVNGQDGNDQLHGGDGNDTVYGGGKNDTVYGDAGDDYLDGQSEHDYVYGGDGNDIVKGNIGHDNLRGDNGDDKLWGWEGTDSLWGGPGNDRLEGEADNDRLYGDDGDDKLNGGAGDDLLAGKAGMDICDAREGNDNTKHGCETIMTN